MKRYINPFFSKIFRVFSGIKLLWNNYDWDYVYILIILKWKLERTKKFFETDAWSLDAEKRAKELKITINLLDRIIEDDYIDKAHEELLDQWWNSRKEIEKGEFVEMTFPKNDILEKKLDLKTKQLTRKKESDWSMLFALLQKNMRKWWD